MSTKEDQGLRDMLSVDQMAVLTEFENNRKAVVRILTVRPHSDGSADFMVDFPDEERVYYNVGRDGGWSDISESEALEI